MQWIEDLKLAIIIENPTQIGRLMNTIPSFKTLEDAQSALALMQEAKTFMESEKEKTLQELKKIKKTRSFLANTSQNSIQQEYRV